MQKGQNHRFGTFGDFTDFKSALSALSVSSAVQTMRPYIGGTAVYKARALYAMYNPTALFDDIKICNNIGVYKTGNNDEIKMQNSIFENENSFLRTLKQDAGINKISNTNFKVFPNPASSFLNIKYVLNEQEKAYVVLFDILGRERMKIHLSSSVTNVSVNIQSLEFGVYTYKYIVDNAAEEFGKIVIE